MSRSSQLARRVVVENRTREARNCARSNSLIRDLGISIPREL
jgi:hypothetical protein